MGLRNTVTLISFGVFLANHYLSKDHFTAVSYTHILCELDVKANDLARPTTRRVQRS